MLQSGTTTFNDMYNPNGVEIEKIYEAVKASKMRCYFSPTLFSSDVETTDETIARTRAIIETIKAIRIPISRSWWLLIRPTVVVENCWKASLELAKMKTFPFISMLQKPRKNQALS